MKLFLKSLKEQVIWSFNWIEKYLIEDLNVLQDNLENPVTTRMEFEARPFILMALLEAKGKLKRIYVGDEDVVKSRTFGSTETAEFSVFEIIYDK